MKTIGSDLYSALRHADDLDYCCIMIKDCCADRDTEVHCCFDSADWANIMKKSLLAWHKKFGKAWLQLKNKYDENFRRITTCFAVPDHFGRVTYSSGR